MYELSTILLLIIIDIMFLDSYLYTIFLLLIVSRSKVLERRQGYIKFQLLPNEKTLPFYEVQIYLGDPKQSQTFIVDTGSFDFIAKVSSCISCMDISSRPNFQPSDSYTFTPINCKQDQVICNKFCPTRSKKQIQCNLQQKYGTSQQNSIKLKAGLIKEIVSFTTDPSEDSIEGFIGAIQQINYQKLKSNGILGLSGRQQRSFIFNWFKENSIPPQNMNIGLCLDQKQGTMQWGAIQQERNDHVLISLDQEFQNSDISCSIGDLNLPSKGQKQQVLIDSGSSHLRLKSQVYQKIVEIISNICIEQYSICFQKPLENNQQNKSNDKLKCYFFQVSNYFNQVSLLVDAIFPQISIKLQGNKFNIKPSYYFQEIDLQTGQENVKYACLTVLPTDQEQFILGTPFLKGRKIIYNYNYDTIKAKIYNDYNCLERKAEAKQMFNNYFIFVGIFLFVFFRQIIVNSARKCCMKKHEEQEIQSQSKLQNEDKTNSQV